MFHIPILYKFSFNCSDRIDTDGLNGLYITVDKLYTFYKKCDEYFLSKILLISSGDLFDISLRKTSDKIFLLELLENPRSKSFLMSL
jgi:hypothetical protein